MDTSGTIQKTVIIASGESVSTAISLAVTKDDSGNNLGFHRRLFGIDIPATYTAAVLTVYQKPADGTYRAVKDENGSELTIAATAGTPHRFSNPSLFSALTDIKLLSGTTAVPVVQTADRVFTLVLRGI